MGSCPITFLCLWPATDHEPHCRHVPINKIWRWTERTPQSAWYSHIAGIYSGCSTHEIIIITAASTCRLRKKCSFCLSSVTQYLHITAGCTNSYITGCYSAWAVQPGCLWRHWVDSQQGSCVDSGRCGTFDRNFKKEVLFIYLFSFLCSLAYDPEGWQKLEQMQDSI